MRCGRLSWLILIIVGAYEAFELSVLTLPEVGEVERPNSRAYSCRVHHVRSTRSPNTCGSTPLTPRLPGASPRRPKFVLMVVDAAAASMTPRTTQYSIITGRGRRAHLGAAAAATNEHEVDLPVSKACATVRSSLSCGSSRQVSLPCPLALPRLGDFCLLSGLPPAMPGLLSQH